PEPLPLADVGAPDMHLVMTVTGTAEAPECALPDWATLDPLGGSVAAGASQTIGVAFDTTGLAPGAYAANLCIESNDPERPLLVVPLGLDVIPGNPLLEIAPESLDFGGVPAGTVAGPTSVTLSSI